MGPEVVVDSGMDPAARTLPPESKVQDLVAESQRLTETGDWAGGFDAALQATRQQAPWTALRPAVLALYGAGHVREAIEVLEASAQFNPRPDAEMLNALGCLAMEAGFPDSGVARLREAVASEPSTPAFLANLGLAARAQGREAEAIACFKRAQGLDPMDLRVDRLALLTAEAKPANLLPITAGRASGFLLPAFSVLRASLREGYGVTLLAAPEGSWDLKVTTDSALGFPLDGILLASVWNDAGMFLREGQLEWVASGQNKPLARIRGSAPSWIQRRRTFRILAGEFMQAVLLGKTASPALRDFSAQGLSYYDDSPPRVGKTFEWRIGLEGLKAEVPAVVRAIRTSPSGRPVVGVEFLVPAKQVDHIARAIHEHQRRLRSFQRPAGGV